MMTRRVRTFAVTDIGLSRKNNEDQMIVLRDRELIVLAVADGMGGASGGEVASGIAVNTIRELVKDRDRSQSVPDLITHCIVSAHQRIRRRGMTDFGHIQMGTTLTMALIRKVPRGENKFEIFMGHVGDSRMYLLEGGGIRQISRDHSMKQYMLDMGMLPGSSELETRYRNVIYRSLGGAVNVDIDPVKRLLVPCGAVLLLCTDGLSNYLKDKEMAKIIAGGKNIKRSGRELVSLAKSRGGGDNITLVLALCGTGAPPHREDAGKFGRLLARFRRGIGRENSGGDATACPQGEGEGPLSP